MATVVNLPRTKGIFGSAFDDFDTFLATLEKRKLAQSQAESRATLVELIRGGGEATSADIIQTALGAGESLSAASALATSIEQKRTDTRFDEAVTQLDPTITPQEGFNTLDEIDSARANRWLDNIMDIKRAAEVRTKEAAAETRAVIEDERKAEQDIRAISKDIDREAVQERAAADELRKVEDQKLQREAAARAEELQPGKLAAQGKLAGADQKASDLLIAHNMEASEANMSSARRAIVESDKVNKQLEGTFRKSQEGLLIPQSFKDETMLALAQDRVREFILKGDTREVAREKATKQAEADYISARWLPDDVRDLPSMANYLFSRGAGVDNIIDFIVKNAQVNNQMDRLRRAMLSEAVTRGLEGTPDEQFAQALELSVADWTNLSQVMTNLPFVGP